MTNKQLIRFLLGLLGVIFLIWLFWSVRVVFSYFAIAVVIALMGRPLMQLLEKITVRGKAFPSWVNALLVMITFILLVVSLVRFLTPILSSQIQIISSLNVPDLLVAFEGPLSQIEETMQKLNIKTINQQTIEEEIAKYLNFSKVSDYFTSVLSGIGSLLAGFMSVLFITFFLLKDQQLVNNIIDGVTPDQYLKSVHRIISETRQLLSRYFLGVALQVSIIATIVGVGLSIVGVPNAILIGIMAGVINIIPYLGPIIGAVLGITLGLLSNVHAEIDANMAPLILKILAVFSIAQLTDNFLLQPIIFSKSVKAHPLEIFVVIVVAGMLVGIVGMILAVPTYTFLRIVAKEFFQGYKVVQGLTKDL